MGQWQIRRIEKGAGGKLVPGMLIAEISAANGSGRLTVHDPAYKEILKELFEEEQFIMMFADDEDGICSDAGQAFPPWHPKSLEYALGRLKHCRLMAMEIK